MSETHVFNDLIPQNSTPAYRISVIKAWLEKLVIGRNLCPFAHRVYSNNKVQFSTIEYDDYMSSLLFVRQMCEGLKQSDAYDTALIVLDEIDYEVFLNLVEIIMEFFQSSQLSETFQIAHFHPQYQFANTEIEENSNYTNRAPFPIIQLLRVSQVAEAVENYPNVDKIPEDNIHQLNRMTREKLREIYLSIFISA